MLPGMLATRCVVCDMIEKGRLGRRSWSPPGDNKCSSEMSDTVRFVLHCRCLLAKRLRWRTHTSILTSQYKEEKTHQPMKPQNITAVGNSVSGNSKRCVKTEGEQHYYIVPLPSAMPWHQILPNCEGNTSSNRSDFSLHCGNNKAEMHCEIQLESASEHEHETASSVIEMW